MQDQPDESGDQADLASQWQALVDTIVDGVIVIDMSGTIRRFNTASERLFGYRAADVIGRNVRMLMPSPFQEEHDGYIRHYLETGEQRIIGIGREVVGLRKDGSTFPMKLSVGETARNGERYFVGVVHDVTEDKQQIAALKRAQELAKARGRQIEALARNLPGPLFQRVLHPDGRITFPYVSDGLRRIFKLDPEAVKADSANLIAAIDPDDRPGWFEAVRHSADTMSAFDYEMRFTGEDGAVRWMHAVAQPRPGEDGTVIWEGVAFDVTDKRAAEEQLVHVQKMEAVGQLTGGIAHDFNNLLTVIIGNLELLEARLDPGGRMHKYARQAQEAADLGAELTHGLLAFARRQPLEPRAIDLNDMVSGLTGLLRRTLGEAIQISTVLAPGLRLTLADPGQVENAIINLAVNARDAMPDGGVLTIETANAELVDDDAARIFDIEPGRYVVLSITDTGSGMPPEVATRAFEPFFTTKEVGAGTGLGLSMVYGFAKQSGGHARIYSETGHGTTVSLYLPQVAGDEATDEEQEATDHSPSGSGEIVLVVEDDPRVRLLTSTRLEQLGYAVHEASDGPEALALLEKAAHVDLLFTDIVMPGGMTGDELARRAVAIQPGIKVLFTSGYAEAAMHGNGNLGNGAGLLRKPYKLADLAQKVRECLEG